MDIYRDVLLQKLTDTLSIYGIAIALVIVMFFLLPWILRITESKKYILISYVFLSITLVLVIVVACFDTATIRQDLEQNSFVEYTGEIKYLPTEGNETYSVFQIANDEETKVLIRERDIDGTIWKCNAYIVYAEHSKLVVCIRVYEITEIGPAISFGW